jgi:nucleotide-binding universal stress UspA family protein
MQIYSSIYLSPWKLRAFVMPKSHMSVIRKSDELIDVMIPTGYEDMDSIYTTVNDIRSHHKTEKQKGLALLEYFVKRCNEAEVDCEAWLSKGDPKLVICKEAKERQPDLLVLGSRGLGTLQRYICHSFHDPRNLSSSIS